MLRHYPLNVRRAHEQQGFLKQVQTDGPRTGAERSRICPLQCGNNSRMQLHVLQPSVCVTVTAVLSQAVTSDVNVKYRALEVQVSSVVLESSGASVATAANAAAEAAKPFAAFLREAAGAESAAGSGSSLSHLQVRPGVLVFWADAALTTHLSSRKEEGAAVELQHALVRIRTDGATLLARTGSGGVEVVQEASANAHKPKPASLDSQPNLFAQARGNFNPTAVKPAPAATKKDADDWDD